MTAQLALFDAFDDMPIRAGTYRQAGVVFTSLGGPTEGQLVHHTHPANDLDWLRWYAGYIRECQTAAGIVPDARIAWREITCSPWGYE